MSLYHSTWLRSFCRKAHHYYQYQYRRHSDSIWLEFCKHFNVPDYEHPDNLGLDLEWAQWKHSRNLNVHYNEYQEAYQEMPDLQKFVEEKKQHLLILR